MYSNTAVFASSRVWKRTWWTCSVLSEAKKLSIGALSKQLPRRLMDWVMPCRSSTARYGSEAYCPGSTGRRNAPMNRSYHLVERLGRRSPAKGLARSGIERRGHGREVVRAVHAQVGALREVLPQQPVGVLVGAALPGAVRVAKVDLDPRVDLEARMLGHLGALIPGQRPSKLIRQSGDRARDRLAHRLGSMAGEGRTVFHASLLAVTCHARQGQEQGEARRALDQGVDCRAAEAQDEVSFPVARHRPVGCLCRTLADHDLGRDKPLAASARACPRDPQRPPGSQTGREFAAQRSSALDEEGLVDGFVADAHGRVVREVDR